MYWWDIRALRNDLKANTVSEADKARYLLANLIFPWWLVEWWEYPSPLDAASFWQVMFHFAVLVMGYAICHDANNRGDGKDFVERIICICWPIFIRVAAFTILAEIAVSLIAWFVFSYDIDPSLSINIMRPIIFIWIRFELLRISGAREAVPTTG